MIKTPVKWRKLLFSKISNQSPEFYTTPRFLSNNNNNKRMIKNIYSCINKSTLNKPLKTKNVKFHRSFLHHKIISNPKYQFLYIKTPLSNPKSSKTANNFFVTNVTQEEIRTNTDYKPICLTDRTNKNFLYSSYYKRNKFLNVPRNFFFEQPKSYHNSSYPYKINFNPGEYINEIKLISKNKYLDKLRVDLLQINENKNNWKYDTVKLDLFKLKNIQFLLQKCNKNFRNYYKHIFDELESEKKKLDQIKKTRNQLETDILILEKKKENLQKGLNKLLNMLNLLNEYKNFSQCVKYNTLNVTEGQRSYRRKNTLSKKYSIKNHNFRKENISFKQRNSRIFNNQIGADLILKKLNSKSKYNIDIINEKNNEIVSNELDKSVNKKYLNKQINIFNNIEEFESKLKDIINIILTHLNEENKINSDLIQLNFQKEECINEGLKNEKLNVIIDKYNKHLKKLKETSEKLKKKLIFVNQNKTADFILVETIFRKIKNILYSFIQIKNFQINKYCDVDFETIRDLYKKMTGKFVQNLNQQKKLNIISDGLREIENIGYGLLSNIVLLKKNQYTSVIVNQIIFKLESEKKIKEGKKRREKELYKREENYLNAINKMNKIMFIRRKVAEKIKLKGNRSEDKRELKKQKLKQEIEDWFFY